MTDGWITKGKIYTIHLQPSSIVLVYDRFLEFRSHLRLQTAETIVFPIDKSSNLRQSRMHFPDFAPHLLCDEPVIGMALRHRPELAQMDGFTEDLMLVEKFR